MYADDTELHLSGHDLLSVQHGFQCNLDAIQAWLCVNRFQLDASKSVVMLIDTRKKISHRNVTVHISGQVLTRVPHTKYLGVFIDQNLTWKEHTEYVLQRTKGAKYTGYITCGLYLTQSYCGFILPILTIVTLCGLPQLHYFQNLWSK